MTHQLLVLAASNGENLALAERFASAGPARGFEAHLGGHVVGRQLLNNTNVPAKDEAFDDLIGLLAQLASPA